MNEQELNQRLSRISTQWTVLQEAHQGGSDAALAAQRVLMQRYCGAVYRYLLGIVRDADAADELAQEFAVRFLQGDFHRASPERGRFRDFLKTSLRNLVTDHYRKRQRRPQALPEDHPEPADPSPPADLDRQFVDSWRSELLARAWADLSRHEQETGQPYHAVLRFRADHPDVRSGQVAEQLGARLGKALSATGVRQLLHRAREKFADFLLADVAASLEDSSADRLEQELAELDLLEYCRPALERRS